MAMQKTGLSPLEQRLDQLRKTLPDGVGLSFAEVATKLTCSTEHAMRSARRWNWIIYQYSDADARVLGYLVNPKTQKQYANKTH
jgi:hypothetical protein